MHKKGITLMLAMIISSVATLFGLGIVLIVIGELGISGSSKASTLSFYAADSGIECALYGDLVDDKFSTSSAEAISNTVTINCNGSSQSVTSTLADEDSDGDKDSGVFRFNFNVTPGKSCATVTVIKASSMQTTIDSFGENIADCTVASTRVIQRGLEVVY